MKRDLLVGVAQWLATPGEPRQNMSVALGMMDDAASRGRRAPGAPRALVVRLRPRDAGPRRAGGRRAPGGPALGSGWPRRPAGARCGWPPGSVPELGEDGRIYDTALVFNPRGELVAWHRKAHLYPPTLEHTVFTPGDRLTTFDDPALGRVGPGRLLRRRLPRGGPHPGPARCPPGPRPGGLRGRGGQRLGPPLPGPGPDQQPVVGAGQPGRLALDVHPAGRQPDRGADRHRRGGGQPGRAGLRQPGRAAGPPHRPAHRLRSARASPGSWRTSAIPTSTSTACRPGRPSEPSVVATGRRPGSRAFPVQRSCNGGTVTAVGSIGRGDAPTARGRRTAT